MKPTNAKLVRIRAHHLLCMFGFRGLGYSPAFVENMQGIVDRFFSDSGIRVEVVEGADDICAACPHLRAGKCTVREGADVAMRERDQKVLRRLGIAVGEQRHSSSLEELVLDKVVGVDLNSLCVGCPWLPLGYCAEGLRLHRQALSEMDESDLLT